MDKTTARAISRQLMKLVADSPSANLATKSFWFEGFDAVARGEVPFARNPHGYFIVGCSPAKGVDDVEFKKAQLHDALLHGIADKKADRAYRAMDHAQSSSVLARGLHKSNARSNSSFGTKDERDLADDLSRRIRNAGGDPTASEQSFVTRLRVALQLSNELNNPAILSSEITAIREELKTIPQKDLTLELWLKSLESTLPPIDPFDAVAELTPETVEETPVTTPETVEETPVTTPETITPVVKPKAKRKRA